MGPPQSSEAIILRSRAYGESDQIVTFLTETAGKLTGIAKGAKNSRRRFANCLQSFTRVCVHFRMRPGATLVFMDSCDLLQPPAGLTEPAKLAYGSYLVELVDQFTEEADPVAAIFRLLASGLDELRQGMASNAFLRAFELALLHHSGYAPQLWECARCAAPLAREARAFVDPSIGRAVCIRCRTGSEAGVVVAGDTLAALETVHALPLSAARQHRFAPAVGTEAAHLMGHLLAQHLPRPLRSVKLIAALTG
jgi:DNA repair protein RecO (recombination protein O)